MKNRILISILFLILFSSFTQPEKNPIKIEWKENLTGDFSFSEKWSYPEEIFKNDFGQLICDGICNPLINDMKEENGKIILDSMGKYYQLVDTTHRFHSLESENNCYEWIGSNTISVKRQDNDTVICSTEYNAGTHCSLQLSLSGNICFAEIILNSVATSGLEHFKCTGGYVKIDKYLWKQNILKAEFNLNFEDRKKPSHIIWWKGKIYSNIN